MLGVSRRWKAFRGYKHELSKSRMYAWAASYSWQVQSARISEILALKSHFLDYSTVLMIQAAAPETLSGDTPWQKLVEWRQQGPWYYVELGVFSLTSRSWSTRRVLCLSAISSPALHKIMGRQAGLCATFVAYCEEVFQSPAASSLCLSGKAHSNKSLIPTSRVVWRGRWKCLIAPYLIPEPPACISGRSLMSMNEVKIPSLIWEFIMWRRCMNAATPACCWICYKMCTLSYCWHSNLADIPNIKLCQETLLAFLLAVVCKTLVFTQVPACTHLNTISSNILSTIFDNSKSSVQGPCIKLLLELSNLYKYENW